VNVAFARTAVHNPAYASPGDDAFIAEPALSRTAPEDEDDLVDRLFTGGPEADG
jgi:hypothetical protein